MVFVVIVIAVITAAFAIFVRSNQRQDAPSALVSNDPFLSLPLPTMGPVAAPDSGSDDPICVQIAADETLRSLPSALMLLSDPDQGEGARASVEKSISRLRQLKLLTDEDLAKKLEAAADSLARLIEGTELSQDVVNSVTSALINLSEGVQVVCAFTEAG